MYSTHKTTTINPVNNSFVHGSCIKASSNNQYLCCYRSDRYLILENSDAVIRRWIDIELQKLKQYRNITEIAYLLNLRGAS